MWKEAIKSEIDSILQNHTWELVNLPLSCKPLRVCLDRGNYEVKWEYHYPFSPFPCLDEI